MSVTTAQPPAPKGLPVTVWAKMPLAKRRLFTFGPLQTGRDGFQTAVIVIAAELALQGVPEATAVKLCARIEFTTDTTSRRKVLKSVPDWVRWAYKPTDGVPLMSGCPKSGRSGGVANTSKMRDSFAPYCDGACAMSCSSFKLNAMPETNLTGTDYEPTIVSYLWMPPQSGGLGTEARRLYAIIASMAVAENTDTVLASSTYLCRRVGGEMSTRTVRHHMVKLIGSGLIRRLNKRTGLTYAPPPSIEMLTDLCERLGVNEAAKWNVIDSNHETLRKAQHWPTWDAQEALDGKT